MAWLDLAVRQRFAPAAGLGYALGQRRLRLRGFCGAADLHAFGLPGWNRAARPERST